MMNRKGSVGGIIIFVIALILSIWFTYLILSSESGIECNFRSNSILKSVNSLEDVDTGLFSGGTIREKTLLFNGGLVATFKSHQLRDVELVLGRKYRIDKCSNNGGRIWYELRDSLVSSDVNTRKSAQ